MTNENIFKEIEEDLERQKYEALWKRYGGTVVAAALVLVLGTAAYNFWQSHTAQMHQKATGDLAEILGQSKADKAKRIEALESFAKQNQGQTQAALAQLDSAALAAKDGQKEQAIKIYDTLAGDTKADYAFRQLGDLLSVQLQLDDGDAATLLKRLQPLLGNNEPWHLSAKEYSGYLALRSGDKIKAKELFTALSADTSVPQSMATRAADMLRLLAE